MKSDGLMNEVKEFTKSGCHACEDCKLYDPSDCPNLQGIREIVALAEKKQSELLYGYRIEDLARVATLMERCDVVPEDVKRLSNNIAQLYGVIMRGIKQDFKIARDSVIMECRYPGISEVLRSMENNHGKG